MYVYDETTGKPEKNRTDGLPMLRSFMKAAPPCHECPKTIGLPFAERHYSRVEDVPRWCYHTFQHWRKCEAVNWTNGAGADPIVGRNAILFSSVRTAAEHGRADVIAELLGMRK